MKFQTIVLLQATSLIYKVNSLKGAHRWTYDGDDGPKHWCGDCRSGQQQSPINIEHSEAIPQNLQELRFANYRHVGPINITNNGHSVVISGFNKWGTERPYIYDGDLKHKYQLLQCHIHWSNDDETGSEHTIGSKHYPAEIHLVHQKEDQTSEEVESDTYAVVGVFVEISPYAVAKSSIEPKLHEVSQSDATTSMDEFQPVTLLPRNLESFYRYHGSLTTPPCSEAVIWTILQEPLQISECQMKKLREIQLDPSGESDHNFRPTQPLHGRLVFYRTRMPYNSAESFPPEADMSYEGNIVTDEPKILVNSVQDGGHPIKGVDSKSPIGKETLSDRPDEVNIAQMPSNELNDYGIEEATIDDNDMS